MKGIIDISAREMKEAIREVCDRDNRSIGTMFIQEDRGEDRNDRKITEVIVLSKDMIEWFENHGFVL